MRNARFLRTVIIALTLSIVSLAGRGLGFAAPSESVLWSFDYSDGYLPSSLIKVGGNLYGTAYFGGTYGSGIVFQLMPPAPGQTGWSENVLWSFGGAGDGISPDAGLIEVGGKLYGTTYFGGTQAGQPSRFGAVFELSPPAPGQTGWSENILWSFGGAGDGIFPDAGLIEVGGKLYGTTWYGGAFQWGTVFQLTPPAPGQTGWDERVIWSFGGGADGTLPSAGLIEVGGKLYGTTEFGGAGGWGTAFELTPPAPGQTQWSESVIWGFGGSGDGRYPPAGLISLGGNLYGTTNQGGASGWGTAFELTPPALGQTSWSERLLWSFSAAPDANWPTGGLVSAGGKLYGTSESGGSDRLGDGAVFELTPPAPGQTEWREHVLWRFGGSGDGIVPQTGLIAVGGKLYGTTSNGGAIGNGTVFEVTP